MSNVFMLSDDDEKNTNNAINLVRRTKNRFNALIHTLTPESRERSIAITKLDETFMWLTEAISLHGAQEINDDKNQE